MYSILKATRMQYNSPIERNEHNSRKYKLNSHVTQIVGYNTDSFIVSTNVIEKYSEPTKIRTPLSKVKEPYNNTS